MKRLILLLTLMPSIASFCFSQDIITKITGDEIKAKVLEIGQTEIKYKRFDNPDGPTYSILKAEISKIVYPNGTEDVFNATAISEPVIPQFQQTESKLAVRTPGIFDITGIWISNTQQKVYLRIESGNNSEGIIKIFVNAELLKNNTPGNQVFIKPVKNVLNKYKSPTEQFEFQSDSVMIAAFGKSSVQYNKMSEYEIAVLKGNAPAGTILSAADSAKRKVKKSDLEESGNKGRIKKMTYMVFSTVNDMESTMTKKVEYNLNEKGFYNGILMYDMEGKVTARSVYLYDPRDLLVKKEYYNEKGLETFEIFTYDTYGNKIESKDFDASGKQLSRYKYKYDAFGNMTEQVLYDAADQLNKKLVYGYDSRGNWISLVSYDANGAVLERKSLEYDNKSRQVKVTDYDGLGNAIKVTQNYYNNMDQITKAEYYSSLYLTTWDEMKYNEFGNTIYKKYYDGMRGTVTRWSYVYDSTGNVIRMTEQTEKTPATIYKREYIYY